jgi:hypothetical protein
VKKTDFQKLKVGQRVTVTGEYDGYTFDQEIGTVVPTEFISPLIRFDTWSHGHGAGQREWHFGEEGVRTFNITVIPEWSVDPIKPVKPAPKKRPHGKQEYKGNGKHEWETVTGTTVRLRVPGGWLYGKRLGHGGAVLAYTTFVPVPEAVGYAV